MMRKSDKMLRSVIVATLLATTLAITIFPASGQDSPAGDIPKDVTSSTPKETATDSQPAALPEKIRIQLHWYPQAQFAGFLMADKKGFFRKEGLNVELKWGGADILPLRELKDGNVEFCTAWLSQAIASRADDQNPCVLLVQLMPRSSMMLVTRKNSGIQSPSQMTGKKIGIWGGDFSIAPNAFFEKYNIKPVVIMQSSSVLPFIKGVVDVASAMSYNEYHKFMEAGIKASELNTFKMADYGLDFPEDGLYTTENFRKNHQEICKKIIRAVRNGWEYSFANREETINVTVTAATETNFITNASHQKWMIDSMKEIILMTPAANQPWGYLAPSTYAGVCEILQHQKLLKNTPPPYNEFYQPITISEKNATSANAGGETK